MEGSKEQFLDLQEKEWLVRMSDTLYCSLDPSLRNVFDSATVTYSNEHKILMETNLDYRNHYRTYRESKRAMDEHKRILRDKSRRSIEES